MQVNDLAIEGLKSIKDYPAWAIDDLKRLDPKKEFSKSDFKSEMNRIDRRFV